MKNTLDNWRKHIDALDKELLSVLSKRMKVVKKIGEMKKKKKIPVLDEKRWKEVMDNQLLLAKKLQLPKKLVEDIYNTIHKHSLDIERE